jgi:hypothetical protein
VVREASPAQFGSDQLPGGLAVPALINGSPTHVLIVHAVVVLLPLSVVASLMLVFVAASRRAFALITLLVAFVACICVPLAFLSGSALRRRLPPSPLINHHVALAHELLPLAALFGLALAGFVAIDLYHRSRMGDLNRVEVVLLGRLPSVAGSRRDRRAIAYRLASALLVVVAIGTATQVIRVGDSGAKAAWHDRVGAQSGP